MRCSEGGITSEPASMSRCMRGRSSQTPIAGGVGKVFSAPDFILGRNGWGIAWSFRACGLVDAAGVVEGPHQSTGAGGLRVGDGPRGALEDGAGVEPPAGVLGEQQLGAVGVAELVSGGV